MKTLQDPTLVKKNVELKTLLSNLQNLADIDFWRTLNPFAAITDFEFSQYLSPRRADADDIDEYLGQLREERYFQTPTLIPQTLIKEMRQCIDNVRNAGFPVMFALLYDVFYEGLACFDPVVSAALGRHYRLIPNFWLYYIGTSDEETGFQPHRDTEYTDTIDENGLPSVLTLWIAVTDATPLNSCIYLVPANRDAKYEQALHTLDKVSIELFPLENIRALPAPAGSLSCWDQYLLHWGSRSSKRAKEPRISYAFYCQRGDRADIDDACIDLSARLSFETRLALVCRGLRRYSRMNRQITEEYRPVFTFLESAEAHLRPGPPQIS